MAILITNGTTQYLTAPTGLSTSAFTISLWLYAVSAPTSGNYRDIISRYTGSSNGPGVALYNAGSGAKLNLGDFDSDDPGSTTFTTAAWHHVVWTRGGGTDNAYLDSVLETTDALQTAGDALRFGMYDTTYPPNTWDGRCANVIVTATTWTLAQVQAQRYRYLPIETPWAWWPMFPGATERLADYSGNGRNLTLTGSATDADPPPISWGVSPWVVQYVAAGGGGTEYTQSTAGTLGPSGAPSKRTAKTFAGALGLAGALVKSTSKALTGTMGLAGSIVKSTAKSLVGTLGLEGALASSSVFLASVAGTLGLSGTIVKATAKIADGTLNSAGALVRAVAKAMGGTLTSAGAVVKATSKIVAGALAFVGAAAGELNSGAQEYFQDVAGTLTAAGALAKSTAKSFAGTLSSAGALSTLRSLSQAVGGTLALAATLARDTAKTVAGTLPSSGALSRAIDKAVAGTLTAAGATLKAIAKAVVGTLTSSGALSASRTVLKAIGGTLNSAGDIVRSTGKTAAGTLTTGGAVSKATGKIVAGILGLAATLARLFSGEVVPDLLDVALSDATVYPVTLATSAVSVVTASDSAVYTVTLSDSTRS